MVESAVVPNPVQGSEAPKVEETPQVPDKFKNVDGSINVEEMAKSYASLEAKMGSEAAKAALEKKGGEVKLDADGKPVVEDPAKKTDDDPAKKTDEELNADFKDATYGKVVDDALKGANLTPQAVATEFARDGEVSKETYEALDKAGFPKALVDQYVAGAKAGMADGQALVTSIQDSVGGEDAYKEMMKWAGMLPEAEQDTFNRLTNSGDEAVTRAAVSALHNKYVEAEGKTGKIILGGERADTDVFRSPQAAAKAITDARKTGDPAIIRDVELKMLRSDVFTVK